MQALVTANAANEAVTTTLAIAEGTERQHKNVMELVRTYQSDLEDFGQVAFETRLNTQGTSTEYALLNEDQATLIITFMRNSDIVRDFKKRLVKEFRNMINMLNQRHQDPMDTLNDPAAMRGILLTYCDKLIAQEKVIAHIQPKAKALDRISTSEGSLCITDAAKDLQMRPKDLTNWLFTNRWVYKRANGNVWIAYQDKLKAGVMEHKVSTFTTTSGEERIQNQARITPKGLAFLAELFERVDLAA